MMGLHGPGEGVDPMRTFCGQGGVSFLRFWAYVFYGRSLTQTDVQIWFLCLKAWWWEKATSLLALGV